MKRATLVETIERVRDNRMWCIDTRGVVWRGETADGNLIETEMPWAILGKAQKEAAAMQKVVDAAIDWSESGVSEALQKALVLNQAIREYKENVK